MCPVGLQVKSHDKRQVVACKSACAAFNSPRYCCTGTFGNPQSCKPTAYSRIFKTACPKAYSYAYDDPTSIATCTGGSYLLTFCPRHQYSCFFQLLLLVVYQVKIYSRHFSLQLFYLGQIPSYVYLTTSTSILYYYHHYHLWQTFYLNWQQLIVFDIIGAIIPRRFNFGLIFGALTVFKM